MITSNSTEMYIIQVELPVNRQVGCYSSLRRHSMSVGPWAVSFSALVPLHESHSESGRLMNYSCSPAVTIHQYDSITKKHTI